MLNPVNFPDTNGVVSVKRVNEQLTSVTISAGNLTTTLTASSARILRLNGSYASGHTVVMPNATTLPFTGWGIRIINKSNSTITINDGAGAMIGGIGVDSEIIVYTSSISSSGGSWDFGNIPNAISQELLNYFNFADNAFPLALGSSANDIITALQNAGIAYEP